MVYLIIGALVLALLLYGGQLFANANPADLARRIKKSGGLLLLGLAVVLAVTGRVALALPAAAFGLSLLGLGGMGRLTGKRGSRAKPSAGQSSRARSALVEMELDHASGAMRGRVLAGTLSGRALEGLTVPELQRLWQETAADGQSRQLVEAYLDRRLSSWREDFQADRADRHGGTAGSGAMTDEEAYQILGLPPDAGDAEIRAAHRRLMKRLHPDQGGTAFLAAQINEAKDRLLGRH
ncbi:DnaJ domain-containing protein [Roseibium litorale]|uniref:DnaJ domain-containing protein n=1 Tax=Roseibium litorale TaxID=2803841 RepID=A0ABR9CIJ8_9HYPH|nr:DnaJ domain-containing protein [Roseibium litorale]MBD8890112.1 DnaJ domain-containing protein [Roseibium litorale]